MTAGEQGGPGKPPAPAAPLLMIQQGFQRGLQYFISDRDWPWQYGSTRVASGILAEGDPEPVPIMRSARQMIDEADSDLQVGDLLKDCLLGG